MKSPLDKLKYIYIPFLLTTVVYTLLYCFLVWLLIYKYEIIHLKNDYYEIVAPVVLSFILAWIFLDKRIRLLRMKSDFLSFPFVVSAFAMGAVAFTSVSFVQSWSGQKIDLEDIEEIKGSNLQTFYTVKRLFLPKQRAGFYSISTVGGKRNQDLNFDIYGVVPIYKEWEDTTRKDCSYWLTIRFHKRFDNDMSQEQRRQAFGEFAGEAEKEFMEMNLYMGTFLERMINDRNEEEYNKAIGRTGLATYDDPIFFKMHSIPFEQRADKDLRIMLLCFVIGSLLFLLSIIFFPFRVSRLKAFKEGKPMPKTKSGGWLEELEFFIPAPGFYVSRSIMNLNILVFVLLVIGGAGFLSLDGEVLYHWGANHAGSVKEGQWWRLIASIFLHGGFLHLANNMMGLVFVSLILEPLLGSVRYGVVYFVCGIIGNITSIFWNPQVFSVGASGAVFGLYGFFLALMLLKYIEKDISKIFLTSTLIFIGYNLIMGMANKGIDNAAHLGGLLSGFISGAVYTLLFKNKKGLR